MRSKKLTFLALFVFVCAAASSLAAQDTIFSDPNADYSFTVPDERWKLITRPSAANPNVEYVFGDRRDAHFEVRRATIGRDQLLADIVHEEEQKRQFLPGYVAGKEENFAGKLRGTVFNFEYVQAGRSMAGRYYFLQAGNNTVFVLRFSGQKDVLRSIRAQVDGIARTFIQKL
jgi:hypothetical protein